MSLAMWLRNGRAQRNLSLDDVARITKIQPRILERLEAGRLDGLPAEVFVRGFVRSFARCVGLDEDEALRRYTACAKEGTTKVPPTVAARAVIDAMGDLAPNARARAPQMLRDEPDGFPAGSMEIPSSADADADAEVPVEISFAEPSLFEVEPISAPVPAESSPVEAVVEAEPIPASEPAADVDAIVVAPPADIDLSAEIAAPVEKKKPKRTRKSPVTAAEGSAPKRRRKVATGTPAEATPVVAQLVEDGAEPVKPARRRKARGSVQPPIIEAVELAPESESSTEVPSMTEPSLEPADDVVAIETTASDGAISVSETAPIEARTVEAVEPEHAEPIAILDAAAQELAAEPSTEAEPIDNATTRFERLEEDAPVQLATEAWTPRMPPFPLAGQPAWRRSPAAPALVAVIDDADPDGAERVLEERRAGERRRTFLPPILLDRDGDRSARQGGLTLAVIILLIAATLTLSYLMRRPSAAGDGVTQLDPAGDTRSIG